MDVNSVDSGGTPPSPGRVLKAIPEILLFSTAILFIASYISPRQWSLIFYYCDCRYWPVWFSRVLWLLAATGFLALLIRNRKVRKTVYAVSAVCVTADILIHSVWVHALFKFAQGKMTVLFREGILPYVYMPVTELLTTGRVTLRLLVLIAVLLAALALLFACRVRIKRQKKHIDQSGGLDDA